MTRQSAISECFKWWQKGLENINTARDVKYKGHAEEIKEDIAFMEIVWQHLLGAKIQKSGSVVLAHQRRFKLAVLVFLAILMFQLPGSRSCFNCKIVHIMEISLPRFQTFPNSYPVLSNQS